MTPMQHANATENKVTLLQTVLPGVDLPAVPPKRFFPHTPVDCAHCGATHPFADGLWLDIGPDEGFYCDHDCAIEDGWVVCEGCGDWLRNDDSKEFDSCEYCEECWEESFFTCERCGYEDSRDSIIVTPDGNGWCESCIDRHYYTCDSCGELVHRDESYCANDSTFCEECFHENYCRCEGCGEPIHIDDINSNSDGESYCDSCWEDEDRGPNAGNNYHTDAPTYNNVGRRRFGIELEYNICEHGADRPYFADVFEYTGREYVSGIMYSDGGLEAVRDFAEYANDAGWTCDNTYNRCGYHLHIDCGGFSIDQLKSVAAAYIRSRGIWEACVEPWRENGHSYSKYKYHSIDEIRAFETHANFLTMSRHVNRFRFINWNAYSEHGTLEIRGHEGTLDVDEVCNWVAAHTRFVDHVSQLSFDDVLQTFKGSPWNDFNTMRDIVGDDIADFYVTKARRHGKRMTILADRFAPIGI